MVVDNKSKEDESMHGDVMLVGDEMVDMLVGPVHSSNAIYVWPVHRRHMCSLVMRNSPK